MNTDSRRYLIASPFVGLAMSACSGLALALAFPKFDLNLLAWVALVPLLVAIEGRSLNCVLLYSWTQGLAFYAATLYWIVNMLCTHSHKPLAAAAGELLVLAASEALFVPATVVAATFISRRARIPMLVTLPIAWPAIEWLRSFFPVKYPWALLGYTAYRDLRLIQFAEFTGVYGVSALIVLVNVAVFQVIAGPETRRAKLRMAAGVAAIIVAALAFGTLRLAQLARAPVTGSLKVAMVQGNIVPNLKWDPASVPPAFEVYTEATESAAREHPDLIVWPETAAAFIFLPHSVYPYPLATDAAYRRRLLQLSRDLHEPILLGAPALEFGRVVSSRNRAYLVSADGRVADFYDKMALVPFSEYVPMKSVLGHFFEKLVETLFDYLPGDRQTIFTVADARLGVLICYESMLPDLARRAVKAGANVLVNIANDAWFGRSSAPYLLLAMTAMRAVETHTPIVRVVNSGISAVISPTGQVIAPTELFTRTTEIETVQWKATRTIYTEYGDVFAEVCFALLLIGLLAAAFRRPTATP
ncbi:MAG: apolipoprotein N-acyltransferase [Isosphaerales bacterium]